MFALGNTRWGTGRRGKEGRQKKGGKEGEEERTRGRKGGEEGGKRVRKVAEGGKEGSERGVAREEEERREKGDG